MRGVATFAAACGVGLRCMGKARDFRVLLFRAPPTEWDGEGRLSGRVDLPLGSGGALEVERLAHEVAGLELDLMLHGPDEASTVSAGILARATGARLRRCVGLAEPGLGLWEGMRSSDLEERCPSVFRQWQVDPTRVSPPQGESLLEASERIVGEFARVLERVREVSPTVGVVVRPMARGVLRCWLEGLSLQRLWAESAGGRAMEWHLVERGQLMERGSADRVTAGQLAPA